MREPEGMSGERQENPGKPEAALALALPPGRP